MATRASREREAHDLPFLGGWCLYLGYELAGEIEPSLQLAPTTTLIAHAIRCPAAAIFDHVTGLTTLVAERGHASLVDDLEADLSNTPPAVANKIEPVAFVEDDPEDYFAPSILRSATLPVVTSTRPTYRANGRQWCRPAPARVPITGACDRPIPGRCAGLLTMPGLQVLSMASPERLVRCRGGCIQSTACRRHQAASGRRCGRDRSPGECQGEGGACDADRP